MTRRVLSLLACAVVLLSAAAAFGESASFRVLAFYATDVEADHVEFAKQALQFYGELAKKDHFIFDSTTRWSDLNAATLSRYQVILWLNWSPVDKQERQAFQEYMEHGGAWMGFHAAGYNDRSTHWPWYVNFLGAVFYGNNWPPLPATLIVEDTKDPITHRLPEKFTAPANEWYSWQPDPRSNRNIKVLLTLDPANYPLGLKDTLLAGDIPVVWTNTQYKMIYMNMGHGDKIFSSPTQNLLFEDALLWLGGKQNKHQPQIKE
jgi:type 1 glutamine amidotransferase